MSVTLISFQRKVRNRVREQRRKRERKEAAPLYLNYNMNAAIEGGRHNSPKCGDIISLHAFRPGEQQWVDEVLRHCVAV